ncbi:MAG: hypothetical protein INF90_14760 [Roseomonas sp.]|nr:hypothetical protein [Roseomonas sp.]
MQRVKRSTAIATMPAPPVGGTPGFFTGGDPGVGQPASVPGYEWFNGVQEELIGLILRGGLTASDADLAQVRKSLDRLFGGGLASLSANTTLTVDDAGLVLVNASAAARTITLPAANALGGRPIRFQIEKTDSTANTVTIQRAGTDTIEGGTSVVLSGQWASVALVSDGVGSWVLLRPDLPAATSGVAGISRFATAAETDAGTLSNVTVTPAGLGVAARSFAANGYLRIPGGGIIQWGAGNTTASPPTTFNFPIAFPTACLRVAAVSEGSGASPMGVEILSNSQFRAWGRDVALTNAPYAARSFAYLAFGH